MNCDICMKEYFKMYYILRCSVFIINRDHECIKYSIGYMYLNNVYFSIYFTELNKKTVRRALTTETIDS